MTRGPSCLISRSHNSPVGERSALVGRQGGTNASGKDISPRSAMPLILLSGHCYHRSKARTLIATLCSRNTCVLENRNDLPTIASGHCLKLASLIAGGLLNAPPPIIPSLD